jgi:hypothetical protein
LAIQFEATDSCSTRDLEATDSCSARDLEARDLEARDSY